MKDLMMLSKEEWDLLIEGVDALKNKGFAGELMGGLFESMLAPKDNATLEEKKKWEKSQASWEATKKLREEEEIKLKNKADLLKAKLILMRENTAFSLGSPKKESN